MPRPTTGVGGGATERKRKKEIEFILFPSPLPFYHMAVHTVLKDLSRPSPVESKSCSLTMLGKGGNVP